MDLYQSAGSHGLASQLLEHIVHGSGIRTAVSAPPGVSSARMTPSTMMEMRSQYSASSIKWVVTKTVMPSVGRLVNQFPELAARGGIDTHL